MTEVRRINLFGGPGVGKSTIAAEVYAELKRQGRKVELVCEFVKQWAYEGRSVGTFDQVFVFGEQIRNESLVLGCGGQELLVTDSPIFLVVCYARKHGLEEWAGLADIAWEFERAYPSFNVILKRQDSIPYDASGRYESVDQAVVMDELIFASLKMWGLDFVLVNVDDVEGVKDAVMEAV